MAAAPAGEVTHVSGAFIATRPDGSTRILAVKSTVEPGEVLSTAKDTYARVKFTDGGEVTLRPNTQLRITAYQFDVKKPQSDNIIMDLVKGGLRAISGLLGKRRADSYQMRTGVATIGIRGTNYGALLCQGDCGGIVNNAGQTPQNGLHVDVSEGAIVVTNQGGETLVGQGAFGFTPNAQTLPVIVPSGQGLNLPTPPLSGRPGAPAAGTVSQGPLPEDCVAQ